MPENFNQPPVPAPEKSPHKEGIEKLRNLFNEAETTLETRGRDAAKPYLNLIYAELGSLNKSDQADWKPLRWNKEGDLTEGEFDELNLRRKKLSNAIGIMTASGEVRHDLNEIE